jgi:hypothetical protein
MSLTKNDENKASNPCRKFLKFKGDTGVFLYWDKEKEENVTVDLVGKTFIVLDQLSTIKGFHEPSNSGIYSNEVKNLSEQKMTVRNKEGILAEGLYKDIKDKIKAQGGKFTSSVYIYLVEEKEMVNLQLAGSALSAWINKDIYEKATAIRIKENEKKKKGQVNYVSPVFEPVAWTKEAYEEACEKDKILQTYLQEYFVGKKEEEELTVYATAEEYVEAKKEKPAQQTAIKVQDLPF